MTVRTSTRRVVWSIAVVVSVMLLGGATVVGVSLFSNDESAKADDADINTTTVTRGDVVAESTQQGLLGYADERPLNSGRAGTITAMAAAGQIVSRGAAVYSVDTSPVVLLVGTVPLWRDLQSGVSDGEDVRQLKQNLADLGMFDGAVDATFTWATREAVKTWQKSLGVTPTGVISPADAVVAPGDLRVAAVSARVGDRIGEGTALGTISSTARVVNVHLSLEQQKLAVADQPVTVSLPDGTELAGTVSTIGAPQDPPPGDSPAKTFIPVAVTLDATADTRGFAEAQVTVRFPRDVVPDALIVPVQALIATDPDTYAVQVVGSDDRVRDVAVTLGVFQSGSVQISGDGIAEGVRVVVP